MYGKIFETMYSGSMVGKGSPMFAVWGYVIANMKPERVVKEVESGRAVAFGAHVELNAVLLGAILGEKVDVVDGVIEQLCSPDPRSRTKEEEGRRLIKLGEFDYRVVNGEHYRKIRTTEERREYQRVKQAEYRAAKKSKRPSKAQKEGESREKRFVEAVNNGQEDLADRIAAEGLPDSGDEAF